jgi:phosphate-selective porin OprO/OprP
MEEHGMQSGRYIRRTFAGLVLAIAVAGFPDPLRAQARREPSRAELEERIRRLEQIIEERGLDKPAAKPSTAAAPDAGPPVDKAEVEAIVDSTLKKQKVLAGWKDGFFLESPSGDFKMKLRGYIQADTRTFPNNGGDTGFNNFTMRRVRPIVEGTVYKYFDYKIMPDFGGGQFTLQDAWAGINYWQEARFRAGKFKPPVSLERLQSGSDLLFVERSLVQNVTPNRDVGFQLAGDFWDGIFSYQIGAFDGDIDGGSNDNDVSSEKEFAGRIFAEPVKKAGIPALAGLGVGVAGTYGDLNNADNLSGLAYRTAGRSTFFKFDTSSTVSVVGDDERHRIVPQGYWYWGPYGLLGEYTFSKQGVMQTNSMTGEVQKADLDNSAWNVQASWVITGEDASYKGVSPINNFDPRNGRWGALELAVRYGELIVDEDAFDLGLASKPTSTDEAQAYAFGVNWYLNRNFKFNFNYEHTDFNNKVLFGSALRDKEDVILTRFQVSY